MFPCRACLLRALRPLLPDPPPQKSNPGSLRLLKTQHFSRLPPRRHAATLQGLRQGHHRAALLEAYRAGKPIERNHRRNAVVTRAEERNAAARAANKSHLDVTEYQNARADGNQRELVAEHLQDPLKLAQAVLDKLAKDEFLQAVGLVRASERHGTPGKDNYQAGVNNVVSWNHLIDHCMLKHDTKMAQKVYNEMKKRGHKPDSHTYTVMLRGFGNAIKQQGVVPDALKVYNSIFAPNSTVTPTIIHTNAVLNVCAKAGNMDEIWAIAGRLPESGPAAPDKWTFTTILNAIASNAQQRAASLRAQDTEEGSQTANQAVEAAVKEGRMLWGDIVGRWRKADMTVDERLVCAMGRLLLISPRSEDWYSVFSLVRQAMNVVPPKENPRAGHTDETDNPSTASDETTVGVPDNFEPVDPEAKARGPKTAVYAMPGRNTLSLVLEAAILTKEMGTGKEFWDLLTSEEGSWRVSPDVDNIMNYLRLLRISRASKTTLEILRHPWPADVARSLYTRRVFVLSMSTCVRDKNNPNVFDYANAVVDMMQEKAEREFAFDYEKGLTREEREIAARNVGQKLTMDPKVLSAYLGLAMATTPGFRAMKSLTRLQEENDGNLDFERDPRKNNTIRALRRLSPELFNVQRLITLRSMQDDQATQNPQVAKFIQSRRASGDPNRVLESMEDMTELLQTMISAYDRLVAIHDRLTESGQEGLNPMYIRDCRLQIQKLSAFHGRLSNASPEKRPPRSRRPIFSAPILTDEERARQAVQDEFADDKWYQDRQFDQQPGDEDDRIDPELVKTPIRSEVEAQNKVAYEHELKKQPTQRQRRLMEKADQKREAQKVQVIAQIPESILKPRDTRVRIQEQEHQENTRLEQDDTQDAASNRSPRSRAMKLHGTSGLPSSPFPRPAQSEATPETLATEESEESEDRKYKLKTFPSFRVRKHVTGKGAHMPTNRHDGSTARKPEVVQWPWGEDFNKTARDMGRGFVEIRE